MKTESIISKSEITIICLINTFLIIAIYHLAPVKDIILINIISVFGTLITLTGFYIGLKQIFSIKKIAENTEKAVNEKIKSLTMINFHSEVARKSALIKEIKGHLRSNELSVCILRMEDFKRLLSNLIANSESLDLSINIKDIERFLQRYSTDMHSLERKIQNQTYNIVLEDIIKNMDKLSTYLEGIEFKIKH